MDFQGSLGYGSLTWRVARRRDGRRARHRAVPLREQPERLVSNAVGIVPVCGPMMDAKELHEEVSRTCWPIYLSHPDESRGMELKDTRHGSIGLEGVHTATNSSHSLHYGAGSDQSSI